ncbi:OadG family protein [bacterium]|nr:OadG family protein [bacterium]
MIENIIGNQGFVIALSGLLVVFSGLVLIALVIHLFNRVFETSQPGNNAGTGTAGERPVRKRLLKSTPVPPEHLCAITAALEIYRKLYYDALDSKITFIRGEQQTAWKTGGTFGQRSHFQR